MAGKRTLAETIQKELRTWGVELSLDECQAIGDVAVQHERERCVYWSGRAETRDWNTHCIRSGFPIPEKRA